MPSLTRTLSATLLALLLTAVAVAGAGSASAHAARIAADPAPDSQLTEPPQRVSATFNEDLQPEFAAMTVIGPGGNTWSTGKPQAEGAVLGVDVRPLGPRGTYTVNYRVTSADGHVVAGTWAFELTVPGTGTPGPPPADTSGDSGSSGTSSDDDPPVWPFILIIIGVVGAASVWAIRRQQ